MRAYGKLLVLAGLPLVAGGIAGYGLHAPGAAHHSLSAKDATVVRDALAKVPSITAGQPEAVDSATQGDDTVTIARIEGKDEKGPLTVYLVIENGTVIGGTYAQDGSAQ